MKGNWLFAALACLCGVLVVLHAPAVLVLGFHLIWIRVIFTKNRTVIRTAAVFYVLGMLAGLWQLHLSVTKLQAGAAQMTIQFQEYPAIDGNQIKTTATVQNEKIVFQYYAEKETELAALKATITPGTICAAGGELVQPEPNRNPAAFNYRSYLAHQHIYWIFKSDRIQTCSPPQKQWLYMLKQIRNASLQQIEKTFPSSTIPYAAALLFGDQDNFEDSIYQLYQRLGVVHLLAISGLHVQLIAASLFYLLIRAGITRERAAGCLMAALPVYAALCGMNPPVVRSVLMSMLLLAASRHKLPLQTMDVLSISFILFVLKNAYVIYHVGFQLSFAVCCGLLLSSQTILKKISGTVGKGFAISLISQLSALPVLSYSFYELSLVGLFANLLYVPLYTYILLPLAAMAFAASLAAYPLFPLFAKPLLWAAGISEQLGQMMDTKWSTLVTGRPPVWVIVIMVAGLVYLFICLENGKAFFAAAFPFLVVLTMFIASEKYLIFGKITIIDVGQGDSILIQLPFHRGTYLMDTGGTVRFEQPEWMKRKHPYEVGRDTLVPFLKSQGISTIDKLILTHSDEDHIGGAMALLQSLEVKEIHITPHSWEKPLMDKTLVYARQKKIPVYEMKNGSGWRNASGVFHYVSPNDEKYEGNNDSLVMYAAIGGKTWLFTGDLEEEGEALLVKLYPDLPIDVLKAGHHGSKTSTSETLLRQYHPQIAILSVGKHNRFGHPSPEVIDRLVKDDVKIYRTDEDGAVQYRFFKNKGTFSTVFP
ncbi:DNA internalization-related competence protein ComEC/Rec2 [Heyndrickxia acidiproducens]|uniref:DNA internalization-related competence protein ComEC/Rec2 n=1 Tax=Heyndrickxia acidiproducens TaxID=1121084 RepID=UPI0003693525|nr:DNA internalization-related competence protein ComEC/Rec2 [Heyndrickxia acidiproducens]